MNGEQMSEAENKQRPKKHVNKKGPFKKKETVIFSENSSLRDALIKSKEPSIKFALDCAKAKAKFRGGNKEAPAMSKATPVTPETAKTVRNILKTM